MPEYLTPGVYMESVPSSSNVIEQASATVGAIIGKFKSGPVNKSTLVTSWADFINIFGAMGAINVFSNDSYSADAVYGFFQNGGKKLYVDRTAIGAAKAKQVEVALVTKNIPNPIPVGNVHISRDNDDNPVPELSNAPKGGVFRVGTTLVLKIADTNKTFLAISSEVTENNASLSTRNVSLVYKGNGEFDVVMPGGKSDSYTFENIKGRDDLITGEGGAKIEGTFAFSFEVEWNYNTRTITVDIAIKDSDPVQAHTIVLEDVEGESFYGLTHNPLYAYDGGGIDVYYEANLGLECLYEGTLANSYVAEVTKPYEGRYDYTLKTSAGELLENFSASDCKQLMDNVNTGSQYIRCNALNGVGTVHFNGGSDGTAPESLTTDMLGVFDSSIDDISMICSPDYTTGADCDILTAYATDKGIIAIIQGEGSEDVTAIRDFRQARTSGNAALYYPYIKVKDPVTSEVKKIPPCGHVMGNYAKVISNRGVWKNPAGVEYPLVGVVSTAEISSIKDTLTSGDTDMLNPLSVNCIMARPNYGICIWGCRTLHTDSLMRYVADIMLKNNLMKSIYAGTQNLVFEPNDSYLWTKARTSVQTFLDTLWRDGAFFGETAAEAYYVKCDESNNPEATRNLGRLIVECGYAQKKPSEFVIIKVAHQIPTAN